MRNQSEGGRRAITSRHTHGNPQKVSSRCVQASVRGARCQSDALAGAAESLELEACRGLRRHSLDERRVWGEDMQTREFAVPVNIELL
jgi:hypothetical protein